MRKINVAIALLFASLPFSTHAAITEARAVVVKGTVTNIAASSSTEAPVVRDAEIQVGSTIGTADKSSLLMEPTPGSVVMVLEKSRVVLTDDDLKKTGETILGRKTFLNLRSGGVQAALAHPKGEDVDFKIKTPQCVAAARGTVYGVSVSPDGSSTTVVAFQNVVVVTWVVNGKTVTVNVLPGQQLTVNADGTSNAVNGVAPDATPAQLAVLAAFVQDTALAAIPAGSGLGGPNTPDAGAGGLGALVIPATVPANAPTMNTVTGGNNTTVVTAFPTSETTIVNQ